MRRAQSAATGDGTCFAVCHQLHDQMQQVSSFPSLPFPSLPFPSLPFPSLPFPSLPFPSLPFPLVCFPINADTLSCCSPQLTSTLHRSQALGRNFSREYVVILRKILRVLENLPLSADQLHGTRTAHGTLGDTLQALTANQVCVSARVWACVWGGACSPEQHMQLNTAVGLGGGVGHTHTHDRTPGSTPDR